jgi:TM2 domain-containing membrane protein YozV
VNPICPYCRTEVGASEADRLDCVACGTPHHPECFAENGGCTVFGCAKAPADEAKISVSGVEVGAAASPSRAGQVLSGASDAGDPFRAPPVPASSSGIPDSRPPSSPPPAAATGAAPPPLAGPPRPVVTASFESYLPAPQPKNRVTYVLLGIFLGFLGVHNFYAGYNRNAAIQLAVTVLTCFYGAILCWIWAIVEVCVVGKDADGESFS